MAVNYHLDLYGRLFDFISNIVLYSEIGSVVTERAIENTFSKFNYFNFSATAASILRSKTPLSKYLSYELSRDPPSHLKFKDDMTSLLHG